LKKQLRFDPAVRPVYSHLEPIVDFLLATGNSLAREYRWGESRSGFHCLLSQPIDLDKIQASFELPEFIYLNRETGSVECQTTWASITGGVAKR
jgi:hypothetical protein